MWEKIKKWYCTDKGQNLTLLLFSFGLAGSVIAIIITSTVYIVGINTKFERQIETNRRINQRLDTLSDSLDQGKRIDDLSTQIENNKGRLITIIRLLESQEYEPPESGSLPGSPP